MKPFPDACPFCGIDPGVVGFNLGVTCGESAGQTIFHTHIHLIPRRENDTPRPRGGVRGSFRTGWIYMKVVRYEF